MVLSRNSATASTIGASAWRMARASSAATRRLLPCANTKPIASAPSSQARRTSPARVNPQNLIRVRNRIFWFIGTVAASRGVRGGGASERDFRRETPL